MVGAFIAKRTDVIVNDTMAYVGRYGFHIKKVQSKPLRVLVLNILKVFRECIKAND
jgi:hypothetical protein